MKENGSFNKKSLFSFSKLNKFFIFPFLMPILMTIATLLLDYIEKNNEIKGIEFLSSLYISFSLILGGFSYFIFLWVIKPEVNNKINNKKSRTSLQLKLIYNDVLNNKKKTKFLILLLMSLIFAISISFNHIFYKYKTIDGSLFIIIFISIFSKFILKTNIFFHQLFSIMLSLIGLSIVCIPKALSNPINIENFFVNLYKIFDCLGYSLFLVLIKYLTLNYYISPYLCLLYIGIFTTIILIIIFIIYSIFFQNGLYYLINAFDFSNVENKLNFYGCSIISFILWGLIQILVFLIIFYFSPILYMVTEIIRSSLLWIAYIIIDGDTPLNIILCCIGNIILLLASLIYNEIIICNFCDLNINTKKFIEEREKEEKKLLNNIQNNENINEDFDNERNEENEDEDEDEEPKI